MRLILIRHGDPDYSIDSLTDQGKKEAAALVPRLLKEDVKAFYLSPLGRAQATASYTLKAFEEAGHLTLTEKLFPGRRPVMESTSGIPVRTCEWLREFMPPFDINDSDTLLKMYPDTRKDENGRFHSRHTWDAMPSGWRNNPSLYELNGWRTSEIAAHSEINSYYDHVVTEFDKLIASHGYVREGGVPSGGPDSQVSDGGLYRVERGNEDTIVFFCHLGIMLTLLGHIWGVSPFILPHMIAVVPSSVTELVSEEREKGTAIFRALRIGDVSHLYAAGVEPSFAARFCEVYENFDQRH